LRTQPSVERIGLVLAVDEVAIVYDAGRAKVVCAAAEGQDEHVVLQFAAASDHLTGGLQWCQADAPGGAVDRIELSGDVLEMMRACVRHILHLMFVDVPGAGGEGVQHRLPDVDPTAVHQADPGQPAAAQHMA
jgi:hypothetical protein